MTLPPELDLTVYRRLHPDLSGLSDNHLSEHYERFGRSEGRTANTLASREDFAMLATGGVRALEIGPFAAPLLRGPHVSYCDVMDTQALRDRAKSLGLRPEAVPEIRYVMDSEMLDGISDQFDVILSSHAIEHQPDLVLHLQQVERRLDAGTGRYFLLIPDKRYCFDRFIAPSTIADILQAHEERRTRHTLKSVVEHRALTTHNDARRHWHESVAVPAPISPGIVKEAVAEWRAARGAYIDVHAWYFTPDSFAENMRILRELELTTLTLERLYPTRVQANEFWAILKR